MMTFETTNPNPEQRDASVMAWRVHNFGSPEAMKFESVPKPVPDPGEVLIKVKAAGVGPWDGWIRAGKSALPQPLPLTLGSDLSGDVVSIGAGVAGLAVGDPVYGVTNPRFIGAYAQYAVASAEMVARKPATISYADAASIPVIAVTAWQGLFDQAQLVAGQKVLIHGAAGNVGAYAVQLARRAGIEIIATAARKDFPYLRELGTDILVDYHSERFEDVARDVDAVLDLVGGETQRRSFQVLRRGGKLVSAVSPPEQDLASQHGVEAAFFLVSVGTEQLTKIAELIDNGALKTRVGTILPLEEAYEAHLMLDGVRRAPGGKIVLSV
ncbi:NADP-dependent oxidoreductase [Rhizobium johnstonii]|jgi:NADPH:quinone reductase-like Zn-dependent oxidoreductase|uniref:NADP-dependent oxidoreductase n=1 Tax=Rhizobium TaxID=379 RepID=UPI001FE00C8D|nr:NADP-dependent oxidoreductase [Rhizobium leguminosarum]WSH75055.1 NADP-dependent oxidoreductase [Rhizobium leguminosarum]